MNLLNNLFDTDNTQLINTNSKYLKIMIIIIFLIIILFCIEKDNYYTNTFTIIDDKTFILVDKDYINTIKNLNTILIDNIETKYSINNITSENNLYLLDISLNQKINIKNGVYKIKLGKEKLFDYIVRIIKK